MPDVLDGPEPSLVLEASGERLWWLSSLFSAVPTDSGDCKSVLLVELPAEEDPDDCCEELERDDVPDISELEDPDTPVELELVSEISDVSLMSFGSSEISEDPFEREPEEELDVPDDAPEPAMPEELPEDVPGSDDVWEDADPEPFDDDPDDDPELLSELSPELFDGFP